MDYTLESYSELLERQIDIAIEGFNADAKYKFSQAKKRYQEAIKQAKVYVKTGETDKVTQELDIAKSALQSIRKEIVDMSKESTISSTIIGDLIALLKWVGTNLFIFVCTFVGGGIGSGIGILKAAKNGSDAAAIATRTMEAGSAIFGVGFLGSLINDIFTIIDGLNSFGNAEIEKKKDGRKFAPSDFNMYFRGILESLDKLIKQMDKVKVGLVKKSDKKRAKLAKNAATKAAVNGDLVSATEALIAMIAYENGELYNPVSNAGLAVESVIECALLEEKIFESTD